MLMYVLFNNINTMFLMLMPLNISLNIVLVLVKFK